MHGDQLSGSRNGWTEEKLHVAVGFSGVRKANAKNEYRSEGSSEAHERVIRRGEREEAVRNGGHVSG